MKPISINELFLTGSGVGKTDLCPYDIAIDETIAGVDLDTVIGTGNLFTALTTASDYKYNMNLRIQPGYFYVTDKEFYYYNSKMTQFSRPTVASGESYASVSLQSYPDSIYSYYEDTGERVPGGAAPIIVEVFQSGELSHLGAIFDTIITQNGTAYGYGYRKSNIPNDDMTYPVISGEPGDYPGYVSPLKPYEKCYESWFTTNTLGEHEYWYDVETNRIMFYGDPKEMCTKEVAVHWESSNEPFSIKDVNLNPVETLPENGIMCLGLEPLTDEKVAAVYIESDKSIVYSGEIATFSLVARGLSENRVNAAEIICLVDYSSISSDGFLVQNSNPSISGLDYEWVYSDFVPGLLSTFESIYSGELSIGASLHCDYTSKGYLHINPGTLITTSGVSGQQVSVKTDANGTAIVNFVAPSKIFRNYDVRISCFLPDGTLLNTAVIEVHANESNTDVTITDGNIPFEYIVSGEPFQDNNGISYTRIPMPVVFSPSSVRFVSLPDYIGSVYNKENIEWQQFGDFSIDTPKSISCYNILSGKTDDVSSITCSPVFGITSGSYESVVIRGTDIYEHAILNRRIYHGYYN